MLVLALVAGCLSRWLDAPYVLTTGLDGATQLDWGAEPHTFVVTTSSGGVRVDQAGGLSPIAAPPRREALRPGAVLSYEADDHIVWIDAVGTLREGERVIVTGLVEPRALTCDRQGRHYLVAGAPEPALYRYEHGGLVLIAEWVGPVVDVAWGSGGWLNERALYLVRSDGILEYLEPPP